MGFFKYLFRRKVILNYSLDVLYFHSPEYLLSFIFYPNLKSKLVLHMHGAVTATRISRFYFARNKLFNLLWDFVQRIALLKADKVITIDNDCESLLKKYNIVYKGFPIRNAVNKNIFFFDGHKREKLRNKLNVLHKEKILLFIGRIVKSKNLELFIKSLKILTENNVNIWYGIIVGFGSEYKNIKKEILRNNLESKLFLFDSQENSSLIDFYCAADIFFLPSLNEGFPMVLLEAIACGLPCIAFNVGGINEIISNEVNGRLVSKSKNNPVEIIENINKILKEERYSDRNKISKSIEIFSGEVIGEKINNLFSSM